MTAKYLTSEIEIDVDVVSVVDAAIIGPEGDAVAIEPSQTAVEDLDAAVTDLRHHQDENETRIVATVTATFPRAVMEAVKNLDAAALHPVLLVPTRELLHLAPDRRP